MSHQPNKKILIIGGSSGMGLATAKMSAKKGFRVIIASRSQKKLEAAKKEFQDQTIETFQVDITDEKSIEQLFQSIGNIDHLVISGSEIKFGNIKNTSVDDAKKSFDSKFFGPFRVIQMALNFISPEGSITLFSGTSGTKPEKDTEILASINSAVESLAKALAISLSPIRVNCIAPGIIDTPVYAEMGENAATLFQPFLDKLLVKRMGNADEAAKAVLYLVDNQYVTGTTLYVDGGHVIS